MIGRQDRACSATAADGPRTRSTSASSARNPSELQGAGRTVVHVAADGKLIGLIAIADAVRPTAMARGQACRSAASRSRC